MKIAWILLAKGTTKEKDGQTTIDNDLMVTFRERGADGNPLEMDFHDLTLKDLEWMYKVLDSMIKSEELDMVDDEIAVCSEQPTLIPSSFTEWAGKFFSKDSGHLNILMKRADIFKDFQRSTDLGRNCTISRFMKNLRNFAEGCSYISAVNPSGLCSSPGRIVGKDGSGHLDDYIYMKTIDKSESA